MNIRGWLRPTNRGKRLLVGLLLAGLFCIQCVQEPQGGKVGAPGLTTEAIADNAAMPTSAEMLAKLKGLAQTDHVKLLKFCLDNYKLKYGKSYTCVFVKQETIRGQLSKQQEMQVKFMDKPFSVVMTWINDTRPSPADRVIYVDGKYNNMVLARPAGALKFLPVQKRPPWGDDAKAHSLKPITEFGFAKATQNLIDVYEQAKANGDLTKTSFGGIVKVKELGDRPCLLLVRELKRNDKLGYPAKTTETYIDAEYLVPVCIKGKDWSDKFSCQYSYKDVNFNANLTESDFLPQANGMKLPQ